MVDIVEFTNKLKEIYPNFSFGSYVNTTFSTYLKDSEGFFSIGITKDDKGVFLTTEDAEYLAHESKVYANELAKKYGVEVIGYYYGIRIESLDEEEIKVKVGKMLNFTATCLLRKTIFNPKYIELYDIDENEKCSTPYSEIKKKISKYICPAEYEFEDGDETIETYLYSSEGKPLEMRVEKVNGGYNLQAPLNYEKVRSLKMLPSIQTLCGVSTNDKEQVMEIRLVDDDLLFDTISDIFIYLSLASNYEIFE